MNNTLRIALACNKFENWFEDDPSGIGVAWHGRPSWQLLDLKSKIGLEYDVVTSLPPSDGNMYSEFVALKNGEADMSIEHWAVSYQRAKLVDFSHHQGHFGVHDRQALVLVLDGGVRGHRKDL